MPDFFIPGLNPLILSLKLAGVTTLLLILVATPLAWWLSQTKNIFKPFFEAIVALPLVLPPTVIGFYMLILLGPEGFIGRSWIGMGGDTLTFSFSGLVIASMVYSLPFVVQPIQNAFEGIGRHVLESAWTLGARPLGAFFSVIIPLSAKGYLTALVLGFAHTLGEFGIVLMVGGNIPDKTRVISIAIYDHVETLDYSYAHMLSAGMLIFSLLLLISVYLINHRWRIRT